MSTVRRSIACLAALLLATSATRADDAPKTGSFEVTFATRSPLSDPKTLAKRLRLKAVPADYELAASPFLVYVPTTYDPARPMGLIVLANYKTSDSLPTPVLPQCAEANVAFVVLKQLPDAWPQRAGLALDAVHNLRATYAIDPRRIYIFGSNDPDGSDAVASGPAMTGLRVGLNFPDVFSGTFSQEFLNYRPVKSANGGTYKGDMLTVEPAALVLAKQRPLVLSTQVHEAFHDRVAASFAAEGFKHCQYRLLTLDQFHYPNYTTDWLPDVLTFMDAATATMPMPATKPTATTRPVIKPSTRPSVATPARSER